MIDETELPFWLSLSTHDRTQSDLIRLQMRIFELTNEMEFLRNFIIETSIRNYVSPPPDPIPEPSQPPNHERSIKV